MKKQESPKHRTPQAFGGTWTTEKLQAVEKYLLAYIKIMHKYGFRTTYVDGFAGSGYNYSAGSDPEGLFQDFKEDLTRDLYKGSAIRALSVDPPFDRYVFIEKKASFREELDKQIRDGFAILQNRVSIESGDANQVIPPICSMLAHNERALIFLDPYGMQVRWDTIEVIGASRKVDLWLLVPLGQAIIRLLTNKQPPSSWARALTRFFGNEEWREHFYVSQTVKHLFGEEVVEIREADFTKISSYVISRLRTVFPAVLDEPILLWNNAGVPIYLLCFAASNPKGAPTAVKIAKDIARRLKRGN